MDLYPICFFNTLLKTYQQPAVIEYIYQSIPMIPAKILFYLIILICFAIAGRYYKPLNAYLKRNILGMYFFFCFIPYTKLCEALEEYIGWWPSLGITTAILAVITRMIYSKPQSNKKHTNQTTNQQEKP